MLPTPPLFLATFSAAQRLEKKPFKSHLAGLQLNRWRPELLLLRGHGRASASATASLPLGGSTPGFSAFALARTVWT